MSGEEIWEAVAQTSDVADGSVTLVFAADMPTAIYRLGERYFATTDQCSHGSGSLSEGVVCGENIECPMHQGLFHIPTGKAVGVPCTEDIKTYPIRIENGTIFLKVSD